MTFLSGLILLLFVGATGTSPDDMENAYQALKQAVSQNDAAQVKSQAVRAFSLANAFTNTAAPEEAEQKELWTKQVAYAKDVQSYAEYALYSTAVKAAPAVSVDLLGTLEQLNGSSKYLDEGYSFYLSALTRAGMSSKIPAVAAKGIAHFPNNEDLLLVVANSAMTAKQNDRALGYAKRLVTVVSSHGQPSGMSAADWAKKRNLALGRGYWIAGIIQTEKASYYDADKNLRAALPFIQGEEVMMGAALFNLGIADYQLGRSTLNKALVLDAVKFSHQAAALKTPYADQAAHNALVMKRDADAMR